MDPTANPAVLIFAALAPVLVMLVKQAKFPDNVNALIAFVVYVAVGTVGALAVSGKPDITTLVPFIATVTLIGKVAYDLFWSQLTVGGVSLDNRVTAATSFLR